MICLCRMFKNWKQSWKNCIRISHLWVSNVNWPNRTVMRKNVSWQTDWIKCPPWRPRLMRKKKTSKGVWIRRFGVAAWISDEQRGLTESSTCEGYLWEVYLDRSYAKRFLSVDVNSSSKGHSRSCSWCSKSRSRNQVDADNAQIIEAPALRRGTRGQAVGMLQMILTVRCCLFTQGS